MKRIDSSPEMVVVPSLMQIVPSVQAAKPKAATRTSLGRYPGRYRAECNFTAPGISGRSRKLVLGLRHLGTIHPTRTIERWA